MFKSIMRYAVVPGLLLSFGAGLASADFKKFVIRNDSSGNSPEIKINNTYSSGATEFVISASGMKAGWGSNDANGATISQLQNMSITRLDDISRFTAGSGQAVAPYFNIWVTDGAGKYAVIANMPSNPEYQPLFVDNQDGSKTYKMNYENLKTFRAFVYETPGGGYSGTSSWIHTQLGKTGQNLTFEDIKDLQIEAPDADYITNPDNAVGTGAPDELGTNIAYGFNWVFGDTLSNYVSGDEGYVVKDPSVDVPEPTTLALLATGGLLALRKRRQKKA